MWSNTTYKITYMCTVVKYIRHTRVTRDKQYYTIYICKCFPVFQLDELLSHELRSRSISLYQVHRTTCQPHQKFIIDKYTLNE